MKQFISPRLGTTPLLAVIIFAASAIYISSCGNNNTKEVVASPLAVSRNPIFIAYDSSLGNGSGLGGHPMVIATCVNLECPLMHLDSYIPVAVGSDSVDYVIEATTKGEIPANTRLRIEVRMKRDTTSPTPRRILRK